MMPNEALDALGLLLPAEFEIVLTKLGVPVALISGVQAPQGLRATEAVRWLETNGRLQEAAKLLRPAPPLAAETKVSIAHLPATGRDLFGRDLDLAWLDACWVEGANVATVVAWGGAGKSSLVNAWLAQLSDAGWCGAERVYGWSFYSQGTSDSRNTSADLFVSAALRWFGDPDPDQGSAWDKGQRLANLIRSKRTLLVLDGMEPLQAGPGVEEGRIRDHALQALVKELAAENKGLCLITTRITVADLGGGDKVRERKLERLAAEAGEALLRKRNVKGTSEELREAVEEYKGHCFALTLLGSYLEDACEGDIRQRKEIGPLEVDERLGGHARRVMAAYESWFQRGPEVAILRVLGLFDRPATAEEVAALVDVLPAIQGLTDALEKIGLPRWNKALRKLRSVGLLAPGVNGEQDKRLDAHPLVREHFGEQVKHAYPEAWREGHRRLYEHLKKTAKEFPDTIDEMALLYAALVHGCRAGKYQMAWGEIYVDRIQRRNNHYGMRKIGAFGSEAAALSAFFDPAWTRLVPGFSEAAKAYMMNQAGSVLRALGRLEEASELLKMALDSAMMSKDWLNAARAANNLSEILHAGGELTRSLAIAEQSLQLAITSGDTSERIRRMAGRASILHAMGRREESGEQFEDAERMQKQLQPMHPLLYSLGSFQYCDLLLEQGQVDDVRNRAAQTLEWAKANFGRLLIALDYLSLGRAHLLAAQRGTSAELTAAADLLHQAVEELRGAGYQDALPLGLLARADLHTHTRDFPAAHRDLAEALSLATRCGFRLHEADTHLAYTRLHLAEDVPDPTAAGLHLAAARTIIDATGYHRRDEELTRLTAALAPA